MTKHFANLCGCGIVLSTCRCPSINKKITVSDECEHGNNWAQKLENELSEQYDVPANARLRPYGQNLEVEVNGVRQILDVQFFSLYGFIITLCMFDETGGLVVETELYHGLNENQLADTIHSVYNSFQ